VESLQLVRQRGLLPAGGRLEKLLKPSIHQCADFAPALDSGASGHGHRAVLIPEVHGATAAAGAHHAARHRGECKTRVAKGVEAFGEGGDLEVLAAKEH